MIYQNKKNYKIYRVESTAIDCTNKNNNVLVYIYHEVPYPNVKYVREVGEFLEKFEEYKWSIDGNNINVTDQRTKANATPQRVIK